MLSDARLGLVRLMLMMLLLPACGGSSAKNGSMPTTPMPTAKGTSIGGKATMTIGPAGGTLASTDGILTLTVPPGALAADVTIGIEPVTNTAPLGIGASYRLTPEGTTFAVPATVRMPFTSADLAGS